MSSAQGQIGFLYGGSREHVSEAGKFHLDSIVSRGAGPVLNVPTWHTAERIFGIQETEGLMLRWKQKKLLLTERGD